MGTDIHGVFQARKEGKWIDVPSTYEQNRQYQLFAVLANVRNGFGFAGVPTGQAVQPIALPRGLPPDFEMKDDSHPIASVEIFDPRRRWHKEGEALEIWMGDHSQSWLTGDEMLQWFDKAPTVVKTGVLDRDAYSRWKPFGGQPYQYSGDILGPGIVKVRDNAVEMEKTPHWTHVHVEWESSLREALGGFFGEVAFLVWKHGEIRFVFGFDS